MLKRMYIEKPGESQLTANTQTDIGIPPPPRGQTDVTGRIKLMLP